MAQQDQAEHNNDPEGIDPGPVHWWFLAAALVAALVVIGWATASKTWQPNYCATDLTNFVETFSDMDEEPPRWWPSADCRGNKQCINGFCQSEEVWLRTNWLNRLRGAFHD